LSKEVFDGKSRVIYLDVFSLVLRNLKGCDVDNLLTLDASIILIINTTNITIQHTYILIINKRTSSTDEASRIHAGYAAYTHLNKKM